MNIIHHERAMTDGWRAYIAGDTAGPINSPSFRQGFIAAQRAHERDPDRFSPERSVPGIGLRRNRRTAPMQLPPSIRVMTTEEACAAGGLAYHFSNGIRDTETRP